MNAALPDDVLTELEALRAAFAADAGRMVGDLAAAWAALGTDPAATVLSDLMAQAHRLAGTAGTFALPALSRPAAALEDCLADWLAAPDPTHHRARAAALVAALDGAARAA